MIPIIIILIMIVFYILLEHFTTDNWSEHQRSNEASRASGHSSAALLLQTKETDTRPRGQGGRYWPH